MKEKKTMKKKHSYIKMLGWMALGGVVGGILGFASVFAGVNGLLDLFTTLRVWIAQNNVLLFGILTAITVLLSVLCYQKGEDYVRRCLESEDDEEQDRLDDRYNFWASMGTTGTSIILFLAIALMAFRIDVAATGDLGGMLWGVGLFIAVAILCAFYQIAVIKQIRRKDPLKRGDASDLNFQKEWLAGCDEAEKRVMYEASYKALHITRLVLLIATAAAVLSEEMLGTGLMTVVFLTLCNIISTVVYSYYSMKLDKKKLEV